MQEDLESNGQLEDKKLDYLMCLQALTFIPRAQMSTGALGSVWSFMGETPFSADLGASRKATSIRGKDQSYCAEQNGPIDFAPSHFLLPPAAARKSSGAFTLVPCCFCQPCCSHERGTVAVLSWGRESIRYNTAN